MSRTNVWLPASDSSLYTQEINNTKNGVVLRTNKDLLVYELGVPMRLSVTGNSTFTANCTVVDENNNVLSSESSDVKNSTHGGNFLIGVSPSTPFLWRKNTKIKVLASLTKYNYNPVAAKTFNYRGQITVNRNGIIYEIEDYFDSSDYIAPIYLGYDLVELPPTGTNSSITTFLKDKNNINIPSTKKYIKADKNDFLLNLNVDDTDMNSAIEYSILVNGITVKSYTPCSKGVNFTDVIPYSRITTGNNQVQIKARNNMGTETILNFTLIQMQTLSLRDLYNVLISL